MHIRSVKATGVVGSAMHRISDTVRSAHSQDGAIVLDVRQGQIFNLNFAGSRILELLKDGNSESEIVERISGEFDVSRDVAESDLREFLAALKNHKLIEEQQAGETA